MLRSFSRSSLLYARILMMLVMMVVLRDPLRVWGRGGTPWRRNSRATPQGLDRKSKIEREEPKVDLRRGSEAGQSRRR